MKNLLSSWFFCHFISENDNTHVINLQLSGSIKHLLDSISEDAFCETECLLELAAKVNTIPVLWLYHRPLLGVAPEQLGQILTIQIKQTYIIITKTLKHKWKGLVFQVYCHLTIQKCPRACWQQFLHCHPLLQNFKWRVAEFIVLILWGRDGFKNWI